MGELPTLDERDSDLAKWLLSHQDLVKIAEPIVLNKRVSQSVILSTIIQLCQGRFLTLEQLAQLLQRHPKGLRDRYLKPLIAKKHLQMRFPETPNRPDQSYTTSGK